MANDKDQIQEKHKLKVVEINSVANNVLVKTAGGSLEYDEAL